MTDSEMMSYLIQHLEGNNAKAFCDKTGILASTVSRIVSGQLNMCPQIQKIVKAYPDVNSAWLSSGEGYPGDIDLETVKHHYRELLAERDKHIAVLMKELELQQRVLERGLVGD